MNIRQVTGEPPSFKSSGAPRTWSCLPQLKRGLSDRSSKGKSGVDYSGLNEVYMERTRRR
ncbi:uncharacterized protein ASPGLDRAFT_43210 [Aspergillus glaucus CBS 516.65]|uniref:Uncharacterized protein n=1 Tax=Aspergillus glaucus CBS 516.65 TaxID=1160497 RepID=A0A1L9VW05_ASPGL|nr:hypothetical protein ASPGLDRAFT_43210 [Aspergillus glaucus CBS 516.65]OJJ88094.1 hypothetical protein ASPGLDRAFT_43210 [Aspergillus glaucus CBS 516.65]